MPAIGTHAPEKDLWMPRPSEGEHWDPHTIHTHYFGFSVPEEAIGAFIYLRWHPELNASHGGVCIFRGTDNMVPLDMEHLDYEIGMRWPEVEGNVITTDNGLRIEFTEPGRVAEVSYRSEDGETTFDMTATALTPLLQRGHVMVGEDEDSDRKLQPGGLEQLMHCSGHLTLNGARYQIDCNEARDRSWNQLRTERPMKVPPVGWSPMYFGEDLAFNQVGYENPDTSPVWADLYEVPEDRPTFHYGWVLVDGEPRELKSLRRNALELHPRSHAVMRQEIEAVDSEGDTHRFEGESIAVAPVPAWPNLHPEIHVYRWTDERGRESHSSYQEVWYGPFQREMTRRALEESASIGR
jgi:hypothetical protein